MAKFRKKRSRSGKRSSGGMSVTDVLLAGAIYGALRPTVANMLPTFFNVGPVDSDNVILGGAAYMASKQKGLVKAIGLIGMGTEAGIVTSNFLAQSKSDTSAQYEY